MSESKISETGVYYGILCGVCGKAIPLNPTEARCTTFRLCDECIKAIKWAKIQMKTPHIINVTEDDEK